MTQFQKEQVTLRVAKGLSITRGCFASLNMTTGFLLGPNLKKARLFERTCGAEGGIWTHDQGLMSPLLYH